MGEPERGVMVGVEAVGVRKEVGRREGAEEEEGVVVEEEEEGAEEGMEAEDEGTPTPSGTAIAEEFCDFSASSSFFTWGSEDVLESADINSCRG